MATHERSFLLLLLIWDKRQKGCEEYKSNVILLDLQTLQLILPFFFFFFDIQRDNKIKDGVLRCVFAHFHARDYSLELITAVSCFLKTEITW